MKGWAQSNYFVSIRYFPGQILSIYFKMLLISVENWYNEELSYWENSVHCNGGILYRVVSYIHYVSITEETILLNSKKLKYVF